MCTPIYLTLADGTEIRICIPEVELVFVPPGDPPPVEDWIEGIRPEVAWDLRAFATVRRVAGLMSEEVGRPIMSALNETEKGLAKNLRQGVSLKAQGSG
jgi:hypothetical protein